MATDEAGPTLPPPTPPPPGGNGEVLRTSDESAARGSANTQGEPTMQGGSTESSAPLLLRMKVRKMIFRQVKMTRRQADPR